MCRDRHTTHKHKDRHQCYQSAGLRVEKQGGTIYTHTKSDACVWPRAEQNSANMRIASYCRPLIAPRFAALVPFLECTNA